VSGAFSPRKTAYPLHEPRLEHDRLSGAGVQGMADAATWRKHVAVWPARGEDSFADSSQISPLLELIGWPFFWRDRLVRALGIAGFSATPHG
jgi:hypothetical protein